MKMYDKITKVIHWFVFLLFAFLTTIVLLQILCRMLHIPQTWIDEISKFTFVWLTYIGGCITVSHGMNITFDLVLEGAKGKKFTVLFSVVNIICLIFIATVVILTVQSSWLNRIQKSPMTGLNMGLVNSAIPIGFCLMIFGQLSYWRRRLKERPAEEAAEEAKKLEEMEDKMS